MNNTAVIITRHQGAVDWLAQQGITGVVTHHATPDVVKGQDVIGNLPLDLASLANTVTAILMPHLPPELRGKELSVEQMNQYATLKKFKVTQV